jgi:hypothetical protein
MQKRPMFPYRRPGQKKRPRNVAGGRNKFKDGRRLPGSPRELLSLLQPATKALAQMLVGKSQASGQLVHARGVLAQAQQMVEDRVVDRMTPADREEFLEQLARLRLTIADAEAEAQAAVEAQGEPPPAAAPPVGRERLREMAIALTTPTTRQVPLQPTGPEPGAEDEAEEETAIKPPPGWTPGRGQSAARGEPAVANRLRLRHKPEESGERAPAAAPVEEVKRQRLRLRRPKPETTTEPPADDEDGRAAS